LIPRSRPIQPSPKSAAEPAPDPALAPPPETTEVRDVDIAFRSGRISNLTLSADDALTEDDRLITITYASGEVIRISRDHVEWVSTRTRKILRPTKPFKPSTPEAADAPRS
jgi:hypothetical protein